MLINLEILQILEFFDLPELFVAKDNVNTKYLCLLVDTNENKPNYIVTPISTERLTFYLHGKLDLREVFQNSELRQWYIIKDVTSKCFEASFLEISEIPEEYLPDEGLYFQSSTVEEKIIVNEALELNNTIIHFSLSDKNEAFNIQAEILGDFLKIFQNFVKFSFKKALLSIKNKLRKELDFPYNYSLYAFASSQGSFKVHLASKSQKDLFGNTKIDLAMDIIDSITQDVSEQEFIERLQKVKGHPLKSYKKLVEKIIKENIKLKYEWYSPGIKRINKRTIDKVFAQKIYDILIAKEELTLENKEFIGNLKQIDVDKGNWRIHNLSDDNVYSGYAIDKKLLEGLTVDTVIYKLTCNEIVEEEKISSVEKTTYELNKIEIFNE